MMNRHFTALKGLAIVLVVLSHSVSSYLNALGTYGYAQPPVYLQYVLVAVRELGLVTVPIFLFLSGCYVVYALQGKGLIPAYKTIWVSLKHVIWPYLIWSIIFYAAIYVLQHERFTLLQYTKDLLVGYPFNFVPLLVFFYGVGPFLIHVGRRHPWLLLTAVAIYQLFLIDVVTPGALGFALPDWARYFTPPVLRTTLALWGIHFPLGIIYGLHAKALLPIMKRIWPVLTAAGVALYGLRLIALVQNGMAATLAANLCPVPVMLVFTLLKRESIPLVKNLEQYGRRAYALYLSNLIVLSIALAGVNVIAPWAFQAPLLLIPVLFVVTLAPPTWLMVALDRLPIGGVQRYVFG